MVGTTPTPRRGKLSEMVAATIGQRIVSGEYQPGKILPTEPDIQTEFGVSRTAVREAVRLLSAKGLTLARPKIGTRVRDRSDWSMLDRDVLHWQLTPSPREDFIQSLFEMREIIEPTAAQLAAERATADDIERLGAAMSGLRERAEGSPAQISADLEFHTTILQASGNPLLRSLGAMIESALTVTFSLCWQNAIGKDGIYRHNQVYEAIRERDAERAFLAMRKLVRNSKGDVLDAIYMERTTNT